MQFHNFNKFTKSVKFNSARYEYGVKEENRLLVPLQQFFNDDTLRPMPDGSKFDFVGEGKFIELKSRTCKRTTYDTTCIGVTKIDYAKQHSHQYDFYFVFQFIDESIWYWKYNPEQPLTDDNIYNIPHYFIPITYLTPMNQGTNIFLKVIDSNDTTTSSKII